MQQFHKFFTCFRYYACQYKLFTFPVKSKFLAELHKTSVLLDKFLNSSKNLQKTVDNVYNLVYKCLFTHFSRFYSVDNSVCIFLSSQFLFLSFVFFVKIAHILKSQYLN